jgi:hypothetical protein
MAMPGSDKTPVPEGLDVVEAAEILKDISGERDLKARLEFVSKRFLGRPYTELPLGGGPDVSEVLRITLEAFDCVTYFEHVLALACSATVSDFVSAVRRMRYERGEIHWVHRNHYMIDWARNNETEGLIKNLTIGPDTTEKICTLDLIAGLPAKTATFDYFPPEKLGRVSELAQTGDIVFFVSTKSSLDFFHTGLLIKGEAGLIVRHAARSAGGVVDQELEEFVAKNEPAGFVLLRPVCQP